MCNHSHKSNVAIEELINKLYPAIQLQFILVSSENDLANTEDSPNAKVYSLINDLKNEFQSLVLYEHKLVFPSILRAFSHKTDGGHQPNISDLQKLTKAKEQHIQQLSEELFDEFEKSDLEVEHNPIVELIRLFIRDFANKKHEWNSMIDARLKNCACFMNSNSTIANN